MLDSSHAGFKESLQSDTAKKCAVLEAENARLQAALSGDLAPAVQADSAPATPAEREAKATGLDQQNRHLSTPLDVSAVDEHSTELSRLRIENAQLRRRAWEAESVMQGLVSEVSQLHQTVTQLSERLLRYQKQAGRSSSQRVAAPPITAVPGFEAPFVMWQQPPLAQLQAAPVPATSAAPAAQGQEFSPAVLAHIAGALERLDEAIRSTPRPSVSGDVEACTGKASRRHRSFPRKLPRSARTCRPIRLLGEGRGPWSSSESSELP